MPLLGVIFFFLKSPRYIPEPLVKAKLYAIVLLTVILPILIFLLLKSRGKISSFFLEEVEERVWPLVINCIITGFIIYRILPAFEFVELHYFFVGILISTLSVLILVFLKFKVSIHMVAAGGVLMFIMALGIYYSININNALALSFVVSGAIATSRFHFNAHSAIELIMGFFIGLMPQLILLNYWF